MKNFIEFWIELQAVWYLTCLVEAKELDDSVPILKELREYLEKNDLVIFGCLEKPNSYIPTQKGNVVADFILKELKLKNFSSFRDIYLDAYDQFEDTKVECEDITKLKTAIEAAYMRQKDISDTF